MLVRNLTGRIFVFSLIIVISFFYSFIFKHNFSNYIENGLGPIVTELPNFEFEEVYSDKKVNSDFFKSTLSESNGVILHFWGTWCGPCEAEITSLINFSKKLNEKVSIILLAINDDKNAILKFLKRYDQLPSSIIVGMDNSGKASDLLGNQKVPETYLFDKNGRLLHKYVGPQDWDLEKYVDDLRRFLVK